MSYLVHVTRIALEPQQSGVLDEPRLIARVVAGDRIAARELYDAHAPRVHRLVYRLTGDGELAQEFTQETFIRAFDHLAGFRGDSALSSWLHRIAVSVTMNGMRKVKRFREREADLEDAAAIGTTVSEAEPDLKEQLAKAIDDLPEIYQTTLIMHDVEGYTHTEIAAVLGVAEGTCKSRLACARAKLRATLGHLMKE